MRFRSRAIKSALLMTAACQIRCTKPHFVGKLADTSVTLGSVGEKPVCEAPGVHVFDSVVWKVMPNPPVSKCITHRLPYLICSVASSSVNKGILKCKN